jgi:hypothetical protein
LGVWGVPAVGNGLAVPAQDRAGRQSARTGVSADKVHEPQRPPVAVDEHVGDVHELDVLVNLA